MQAIRIGLRKIKFLDVRREPGRSRSGRPPDDSGHIGSWKLHPGILAKGYKHCLTAHRNGLFDPAYTIANPWPGQLQRSIRSAPENIDFLNNRLREGSFDPSHQIQKINSPRLLLQPFHEGHRSLRFPIRGGQRMISPRSEVRTTSWVK